MKKAASFVVSSDVVLLGMTFCTVLVTSTFLWDGPTVSKTFGFLIASAILVPCLIWQLYKSGEFKINAIDLFFVFYILYLTVQVCLNSSTSFTNHTYVEWLDLFVLYVFVKRAILKQRIDINHVFIICLIVGIIQLAWATLQLYGFVDSYSQYFKITGSFSNPNPFACFVAVIFPLAVVGYLYGRRSDEKGMIMLRRLSIVFLFLFLTILPATNSRTAWLISLMIIVVACFVRFNFYSQISGLMRSKFRRLIALATLSFLVASCLYFVYDYKKDSADGRMLIWKLTARNLPGKVLVGNGFNSFPYYYNSIQADYFAKGNGTTDEIRVADYVPYAFNDYLQMVFEGGIVKLLLFLGIILLALSVKVKDDWKVLATKLLIISVLVSSLFSYSLEVLPIKVLLITAVGILSAKFPSFNLSLRRPVLLFSVIALPAITCSVLVPFQQFNAYRHWIKAYIFQMEGMAEEANQLFEKAYPALAHNTQFLQSYGKNFSILGKYDTSNQFLQMVTSSTSDPVLYSTMGYNFQNLKQYEQAEKYYKFADNIAPNKFYSKFLLAKMYFELRETDKFDRVANQILSMEVKVHTVAIDQIKSHILLMQQQIKLSDVKPFTRIVPEARLIVP